MAGIRLDQFGGIQPRVSKQLLDGSVAQTAENCRLIAGRLETWKDKAVVSGANLESGALSAHLWRYVDSDVDYEKWLSWASDVDVVRGPIANDQYNRVYFTEGGVLKLRRFADTDADYEGSQEEERTVGIPKPSVPTLETSWIFDPTDVITAQARVSLNFQDATVTDVVDGVFDSFEYDDNGKLLVKFSFPGVSFDTQSTDSLTINYNAYLDRQLIFWDGLAYETGMPDNDPTDRIDWNLHYNSENAEVTIREDPSDDESAVLAIARIEKHSDSGFGLNWSRADSGTTASFNFRTSPFTITFTIDISYSQATSEHAVYVQTYVDDMGAESPPSDASAEIEIQPGEQVELSLPAQSNIPSWVVKRRVYRSASNSAGEADYYYVDEVDSDDGSAAELTDAKRDADLAEIMPRFENPPGYDDPNLSGDDDPNADLACYGLVSMAGGFLAAFDGRDVYFSEPYLPYSWPTEYRLAVDFDVVGLAAIGNDLLVLTEGTPYLIAGSHPEMLTQTLLMVNQSCTSKRGICRASSSVFYPSPDGMVIVRAGGSAMIATEKYFSRREWQDIDPGTMVATSHDDKVFAFTSVGGYVFDFTEGAQAVTTLDQTVNGLYSDLEGDTLYLMNGTYLYAWEGHESDVLTLKWRTKQYTYARTLGFKVVRVRADDYPVTFRAYAGDALVHTESIASAIPVRLPVLDSHREWEFEVESEYGIDEVLIEERQINEISEPLIRIRKSGNVFTWYGKEFNVPSRSFFSAARVDAESYPVTIHVYIDGDLQYTRSIADANPVRIPSLPNGRLWDVDAILNTEAGDEELDIFEVALATSMRALR